MPQLPNLDSDVYFGDAEKALPNWREVLPEHYDEADDDEELSPEEYKDIVGMLGFDPNPKPEAPAKPEVKSSPFAGRSLSKAFKEGCSWVTTKVGSRICIGGDGTIEKGPEALIGKTPQEITKPKEEEKPKDTRPAPKVVPGETVPEIGLKPSVIGEPKPKPKEEPKPKKQTPEQQAKAKEYMEHFTEPKGMSMSDAFKQSQAEWAASLKPDELKAINAYTSTGRETGEKHFDYEKFNKRLRKCPDTMDCLSPSQKKVVDGITSALQKSKLPEPVTTYRGVSIDDPKAKNAFIEKMQKALDTGATFPFHGVVSTSLDKEVAQNYGHTIFNIKAKTGAYIEPLHNKESAGLREDQKTANYEVLQAPGTKYKVKAISKEEHPYWKQEIERQAGTGGEQRLAELKEKYKDYMYITTIEVEEV